MLDAGPPLDAGTSKAGGGHEVPPYLLRALQAASAARARAASIREGSGGTSSGAVGRSGQGLAEDPPAAAWSSATPRGTSGLRGFGLPPQRGRATRAESDTGRTGGSGTGAVGATGISPLPPDSFDPRLLPVPVSRRPASRSGWTAFLGQWSSFRLVLLCLLGLGAGGLAGALFGILHLEPSGRDEAPEPPTASIADSGAREPAAEVPDEPAPEPRTGPEEVEITAVPPLSDAAPAEPDRSAGEAPAAVPQSELRAGPALAFEEEAPVQGEAVEPAAGPPALEESGSVPATLSPVTLSAALPNAPTPTPVRPAPTLHQPPPVKPAPSGADWLPAPPAPRAPATPVARPPLDDRPEGWDQAYALAHRLQADGRLEEAVAMYGRAAAFEPEHAVTFYEWGYALQKNGRFEEAAEKYRRALELSPNHAHAHYNLGYVLQQQGELDAAVDSYRRAVVLDADNPFIFYNWGEILFRRGDAAGAADLYTRAAELAQDGPPGDNARGRLAELEGGGD